MATSVNNELPSQLCGMNSGITKCRPDQQVILALPITCRPDATSNNWSRPKRDKIAAMCKHNASEARLCMGSITVVLARCGVILCAVVGWEMGGGRAGTDCSERRTEPEAEATAACNCRPVSEACH
eukprot:6649255-Prymnesium_polylepis.1